MKIAGYIADLLYEYECVVIPGLGGFLTRDHPAYIHPMKHYFKPPHREVVFNPMLRTNDGLLLSHIARYEKLTYQEAKSKLDRFVLRCITMMDEGKKIKFRNIGNIFLNKDKQLVFEPDTSQNYLASSFGLSSFVSPPVKRDDFQRKVEKVFNSPPPRPEKEQIQQKPVSRPTKEMPPRRMLASRRPNRIRKQLAVVGTAATMILAVWAGMNHQTVNSVYQQYKSKAALFPIFYSSPNEYILSNYEKFPLESAFSSDNGFTSPDDLFKAKAGVNDLIPAGSYKGPLDSNPVVSEEPVQKTELEIVPEAVPYSDSFAEEPKHEQVVEVNPTDRSTLPSLVEAEIPVARPIAKSVPIERKQTDAATKTYHIIAGAFKDKVNAERLIATLNQKSFNATLAGKTTSGLWRVSYGEYLTEEQALQQLAHIRQQENSQAWLLAL